MKFSSASLPRFELDLNADDGRPSAMPLEAGGRASYAPGPGVRWFLSILALSLASSKAALAAAGVCVAGSQQQGKASGEACDVSPGLACIPLAEFWGLKFMEAGMSPPSWIPTRTHGWEPSKQAIILACLSGFGKFSGHQ